MLSLKECVRQLERQGDLRQKSFRRMRLAHSGGFLFFGLLFVCGLVLALMSSVEWIVMALIGAGLYSALWYDTRIHSEIVQVSIGDEAEGVIVECWRFTIKLDHIGWGGKVEFDVGDENLTSGKYRVRKSELGGVVPKVGDKVVVFYDPESPVKQATVFVPGHFNRWCLSISRYKQYTDRSFRRRN